MEDALVSIGDFTVTAAAQRPVRMDGACFYCNMAIGQRHKSDCVVIQKKVRVRLTIEYDVNVPATWTSGDVEFHRNESSWCASNLLDELKQVEEDEGCLCGVAKFEFLDNVSGPFRNE